MMRLTINLLGGGMKIPFSEIAKAIGLYQSISKPIGKYPNETESGLLKLIKEQEDALYAKKQEVAVLKEDKKEMQKQIKELEDRVNDVLQDLDKVLLSMENK
jgi:hypothetical protein